MDRVDSGFTEPTPSVPLRTEQPRIQRCNTAPTATRNSKINLSGKPFHTQTTMAASNRPSTAKPVSKQRKPLHSRRQSNASSSGDSTTRSRGRHGSKPSSRRTSVTFVNPSRPVRHHRIKSSYQPSTNTVNNHDIDDVLALHFRSCSLFQSPSLHSALPSPTWSGQNNGQDIDLNSTGSHQSFLATPQSPAYTMDGTSVSHKIEEPVANPTTHWLSPSTRKRQYEKIDRANSGIRGLVRKILPRCVSGPPPPRFYAKDEVNEEEDDNCSVRRYRMDLCDQHSQDEKTNPKQQSRSRSVGKHPDRGLLSKTRWPCFRLS